MEPIQGSETSANYNLTPGKYPKEHFQYNNVFSRAGHIKEIRDEEHKHKVAGKYDAGNFGLLVVWMDQMCRALSVKKLQAYQTALGRPDLMTAVGQRDIPASVCQHSDAVQSLLNDAK